MATNKSAQKMSTNISLDELLSNASTSTFESSRRTVEVQSAATASFNEIAMSHENSVKAQELFQSRIIEMLLQNNSALKTQLTLVNSNPSLSDEEKTQKASDLVYNAITTGNILGAFGTTSTFGRVGMQSINRATVVNNEIALQGRGRQILNMPEVMKAGNLIIASEYQEEMSEDQLLKSKFRPSVTYHYESMNGTVGPNIKTPKLIGSSAIVNVIGSIDNIPLCVNVGDKVLAYSAELIQALDADERFKGNYSVAYTPIILTMAMSVEELKVINDSGTPASKGDSIASNLGMFILMDDNYTLSDGTTVSEKCLVNILDPKSLIFVSRDGQPVENPIISAEQIEYLKSLKVIKTTDADFQVIPFESNQNRGNLNMPKLGGNLGRRIVQ